MINLVGIRLIDMAGLVDSIRLRPSHCEGRKAEPCGRGSYARWDFSIIPLIRLLPSYGTETGVFQLGYALGTTRSLILFHCEAASSELAGEDKTIDRKQDHSIEMHTSRTAEAIAPLIFKEVRRR